MSPFVYASFVTFLLSIIKITHATTITVVNNCNYPVWAAADPLGQSGDRRLDRGNSLVLSPPRGTRMARVWGRTGCNFDGNGNGNCNTGGCGKLVCNPSDWGLNPKTLFEYTLAQSNNPNDVFDISLIEGFNIPISLVPTSNVGSLNGKCRTIRCTADINGQCPANWRTTGGCYNPCTRAGLGSCGANGDNRFFKERCPDAYSFPEDDQTSTFSCPGGTNYRLTFCP